MHFDPFTDAGLADPYPQYAALRAEDPVHWSEKHRAWVLFRYDDVAAAFRGRRVLLDRAPAGVAFLAWPRVVRSGDDPDATSVSAT